MQRWRSLFAGALLGVLLPLAATPCVAQGVRLADGNDWLRSSPTERRAYLVGISNMLTAGSAYEARKLPGENRTFVRQAVTALHGATLDSVTAAINRWYGENPNQMDKPIVVVAWREFVKPKLPPGQ